MDRVRTTLSGAIPPVYLDPGSPSTPPAGTFQTNAALPATSLTPEHANLITEEMRNLVIALGGTPASDDDTQLATLIAPAINRHYGPEVYDLPFEGAALFGPGSPAIEADGKELGLSSATDRAYITIPLRDNEILDRVSARYQGASSPEFSISLFEYIDGSDTPLTNGTTSGTSTTADWLDLDLTLTGDEHQKSAREARVVVELQSISGDITVFKVEYQSRMPTS